MSPYIPSRTNTRRAAAGVHAQSRGVSACSRRRWRPETSISPVSEHSDEITGYATSIGFVAHAVAKTNQDLKALIGAATEFPGPGFLLPTRNHEVFGWCLNCGLKLVFQMTLISIGLYNEPAGAYLPSILY